MKISELRPGMKKVDVKGKIIELSEPREVITRFGGISRVATAILADDSGRIKLSLWNDDINDVSVNDEIAIKNGYVTSFRGEIQLNIGKYGKLSKVK